MSDRAVIMGLSLALTAIGWGCGGEPALRDAAVDPDADPTQGCLDDEDCDDGIFCNGAERCDSVGRCARGADACAMGEVCREGDRACAPAECESADEDGDGHASLACGGDDCDDADPNRFPGRVEVCDEAGHDEDCDPSTFGYRDADADGYVDAACCDASGDEPACGTDCDDARSSVHPALPDLCGDGVDNDCDGATDEGGVLYIDVDNDGRGDPDVSMTGACTAGWVSNADDCDDTRSETYGGPVPARERCDGLDNDCSQAADAAGGPDPSEDADGDGHSPPAAACLGRGEPGAIGFEFLKDDCDDEDPSTHAGAVEICGDGIDQDCDRVVDNPSQQICSDVDGDGHGDPRTRATIHSCEIPEGHVPGSMCADCNDANAAAYPGNREICDRLDNDCSGGGGVELSEDVDGDGFAPTDATCAGRGEADVPDTALPRIDCADSDFTVNPSVIDVCDGWDADCSSGGGAAPDEDADADGHASTDSLCVGALEPGATGAAFPRDDCDDSDPSVHGGRSAADDIAVCDGVDLDCDPVTREVTHPCPLGGWCGAGGRCDRALRVLQLEVGNRSVCARLSSGDVQCWGSSGQGRLGDGSTSSRAVPGPVPGLTGVVDIAVGNAHACALVHDGTVRCWGFNGHGQLGDGTETTREAPTPVTGLTEVLDIAAGDSHTCAARADGAVLCWGSNQFGQVAGDLEVVTGLASPRLLTGVGDVVELAAGGLHTCARTRSGEVLCWGDNSAGQLGTDDTGRVRVDVVPSLGDVQAIAAGDEHSCALLGDASVECWGNNTNGQIGDGTTSGPGVPPTTVSGLNGAVAIEAGFTHTCAVTGDGRAWCWGLNSSGSLGVGDGSSHPSPTEVAGRTGVLGMSTGFRTSCAWQANGSAWCWGYNDQGQVGDSTTTSRHEPVPVVVLGGVRRVASGFYHRCLLFRAGGVRCWGANFRGELGDGTNAERSTPGDVDGLGVVVDLGLGRNHTCAVEDDSTVQCWGSNQYGQLGDGTTDDRGVPGSVPGVTDVVQIVGGTGHTCARHGDLTVSCWGRNSEGQLGDGGTTSRGTPAPVPGLTGVVQLVAGAAHTCARLTDGQARCWGLNAMGQVGDGTFVNRPIPTAASLVGTVVQLEAAGRHSCARMGDGTLRCWGDNDWGQLGDGTTDGRNAPVPVTSLSGVADVHLGAAHTCAALGDGSVHCWGSNVNGEVGDGSTTTTSRTEPAPISLPGVPAQLSLWGNSSCALTTDGSLHCWGDNQLGQLGDGTTDDRYVPATLWSL